MNRTEKFIYNSVTTALLQVITMIVGIMLPRIMIQFYGSEINGLISSISQFIAYFSLVEAGLSNAAIYALYRPLADENHAAVSSVVKAARDFYMKAGYIFVSLTLAMALIYPTFIDTNSLTPLSVGALVMVLGFSGAFEFFTLSKYRVILSADQKSYIISLASILQIILNATIIIILSYLEVNIVLVRIVALSSLLARSIILTIYVKKKYSYLDFSVKPDNQALDKKWDVLYHQITSVIQRSAPVVLSTIFTNLQTVSIYTIYNMVMAGIDGILSIFINSLSAAFGDIIARGESEVLKKTYLQFEFSYYVLITVVYSTALIMIMPFIILYTRGISDINYNIPTLGFLIVVNGLLYNIKTPQGMLSIAAGLYKETKVQATIQGLIIVGVGAILTPKYGLIGIMLASCLSNIYRDFDLVIFISKNVTSLPVKNTLFRIFRIIIEMIIICAPFYYIELSIRSFTEWLIVAFLVGLYAVLIVFVGSIIFDRKAIDDIYKRLMDIGIRKK